MQQKKSALGPIKLIDDFKIFLQLPTKMV